MEKARWSEKPKGRKWYKRDGIECNRKNSGYLSPLSFALLRSATSCLKPVSAWRPDYFLSPCLSWIKPSGIHLYLPIRRDKGNIKYLAPYELLKLLEQKKLNTCDFHGFVFNWLLVTCMGTHATALSGGQRATLWSSFSLSTFLWVLGVELKALGTFIHWAIS